MNPNTERFRRAMARGFAVRGFTVLGSALFAAIVALALIVAPIGPAGASDSGWHPALAAEIPPDGGDHDPRDGHAPPGDRDDGDDLTAVQPGLAGFLAARAVTRAGARRRGIRSPFAAAPRGPPAA